MAPLACKNRPKKDGRRERWLIFNVSWPLLSEVSGSATAGDAALAPLLLSDCLRMLRGVPMRGTEVRGILNVVRKKYRGGIERMGRDLHLIDRSLGKCCCFMTNYIIFSTSEFSTQMCYCYQNLEISGADLERIPSREGIPSDWLREIHMICLSLSKGIISREGIHS